MTRDDIIGEVLYPKEEIAKSIEANKCEIVDKKEYINRRRRCNYFVGGIAWMECVWTCSRRGFN